MYWGAIAAKRSGDLTLARERIEQFLARFPQSDYAEQLTADLAP
jgi:TolA-binding protein